MDWISIFALLAITIASCVVQHASALDFFFNSFNASSNLLLVNDAKFESGVVRLTNDSNQFSYGRAFYPTQIRMKRSNSSSSNNSSSVSSFSSSFVFSILPDVANTPGFGLAFVLSYWTSPPNALASQYFGVFSNATVPAVAPLLAVEFDVGRNTEFNEENGNHIGVDLNYIESAVTKEAGYYDPSGSWIVVEMRNGQNIQAWIDFEGAEMRINVTIAPVGVARPSIPTLSYTNPDIENYLSDDMYIGFSASKSQWVEAQRILAWSLSDVGAAGEINVSGLPVFSVASPFTSSLTAGAIAGIAVGASLFMILCLLGFYWFWRMTKLRKEDEIEDWEMEYWPHRYSYEELSQSTNKFSKDELLGLGGFGKVFKGVLKNGTVVAVKCINHDSKQGLREFMAEIGSMGRLQHKNLVQMRGWCRRGNELMLVYDYMPNGSLNRWIFDKPTQILSWPGRLRVLSDVAEGLNYLHNGWDQVVIHRDIKSSNVLLDADMRGRLGDFGLAKLHQHGEVPGTTRVVGTLGYLAPELAKVVSPTTASDVYSFGVVVLEVACGRRPIDMAVEEEEQILVDWVRDLYKEGNVSKAADKKLDGEYDKAEMESVMKLGLACCHPDPNKRPTMKEVVSVFVGEAAAEVARVDLLASVGGDGSGDVELGEAALLPLQLARSLS
uniref:non-specific serine/threonine protein kinase n=1 Tax=Kalanchoe fedtschenkoi TaxID=63787 RepID=A0A7N0TZT4_KALFE